MSRHYIIRSEALDRRDFNPGYGAMRFTRDRLRRPPLGLLQYAGIAGVLLIIVATIGAWTAH